MKKPSSKKVNNKKTFYELEKGMNLTKCRKCGCMEETLKLLRTSILEISKKDKKKSDIFEEPLKNIDSWIKHLLPVEYSCLGCDHCFPAAANNLFDQSFPQAKQSGSSCCSFEIEDGWPAVPGEFFALCTGIGCPVAVSTLASVELAEKLAGMNPKELCIVGKTETENIGIDKIIINVITNPAIRFLIVAGIEPKGHHSGKTLLALHKNGVDKDMRVIDSPGIHPILKNVTRREVNTFKKQVKVVDMIGCEDADKIVKKMKDLSGDAITAYKAKASRSRQKPAGRLAGKKKAIKAKAPAKIELDKAGYFVIIPEKKKKLITVEHYSYDNKLKNVIQGSDAKSIYATIIQNGWITRLYHAAYLGKELEKAELSIKLDLKYSQDGA
jgi:tetrahydromethanopterin S-methyltransferase subunit A